MNKSILYLRTDIDYTPLLAGGSVAHTIGVIKAFCDLGYNVFCATSVMQDVIQKLPIAAFFSLKNPSFLKSAGIKINSILSNLFFTIFLYRTIRHKKFDYIYQRYSLLNCTGVILRFFFKIPLIIEFNSSKVWVEKNWSKTKRLQLLWLVALIERINIRYSDKIVVVSKTLEQQLIGWGVPVEKIIINPNGVDIDFYTPAVVESPDFSLKKEAIVSDERSFIIGFVGTFSYWHGIELLTEAIIEAVKQEPQLHFLLIGDGPLLSLVKQQTALHQCSRHITYTGLVAHQKARDYMAHCDAFICPTVNNSDGTPFFGSPTKLFEYMSMSKPIIASAVGQITDIISPALSVEQLQHGLWSDAIGILVQPNDSGALAQACIAVARTPIQDRLKLGNAARARVIERHTWKGHVQHILVHLQ